MPQYQNQSKGTVIAGRGVRFAPGEIKSGDYQKYADAGVLVLVGDESKPEPEPAPAPAPEVKPPIAPSVIKEVSKPEPSKGSEAEKVLSDLERAKPAKVDVKNEPEPEPEKKSSPRASRRKKHPKRS